MRKLLATLLAAALIAALAGTTFAQAKKAAPKPAKQGVERQARFHGKIVRFSDDKKTIDLQKGNTTKTIVYGGFTEWTRGKNTVAIPQFKPGMELIAIGKLDEAGRVAATRIEVR